MASAIISVKAGRFPDFADNSFNGAASFRLASSRRVFNALFKLILSWFHDVPHLTVPAPANFSGEISIHLRPPGSYSEFC